jgi:DNA-binding transcriptional ArsR family regulator
MSLLAKLRALKPMPVSFDVLKTLAATAGAMYCANVITNIVQKRSETLDQIETLIAERIAYLQSLDVPVPTEAEPPLDEAPFTPKQARKPRKPAATPASTDSANETRDAVVGCLDASEPVTVSDIAATIGKSGATVRQHVNALIEDGIAMRETPRGPIYLVS